MGSLGSLETSLLHWSWTKKSTTVFAIQRVVRAIKGHSKEIPTPQYRSYMFEGSRRTDNDPQQTFNFNTPP
jgi:hypothetical protein